MNDEKLDLDILKSISEAVDEESYAAEESSLVKLAALCFEFDLAELVKEASWIFNEKPTPSDEDYLKENSIYIAKRKTYSLKDDTRKEILSASDPKDLVALLNETRGDGSLYNSLLKQVFNSRLPRLEEMSMEQLLVCFNISKWLSGTTFSIPDQRIILRLISKEELVIPFNRLTQNFKGRKNELNNIAAYVDLKIPVSVKKKLLVSHKQAVRKLPLFITGVGGLGKSTVVAKFIVENTYTAAGGRMPFVYIDFDKIGFSVVDIFALLKEALRQLSIQFEQYESSFTEIIDIINFEYKHELKGTSRGSDRATLYQKIISRENEGFLKLIDKPVVIVLDSFEELQYKANETDIKNLFSFIDEINEIIPQLRVIFVGRSEIDYADYEFNYIPLPGFDGESAAGFLASLGIKDQRLHESIFSQFGGSPLTLRLAAQLLLKEPEAGDITYDQVQSRQLFANIDKELIEQQLVKRNLEHIHDTKAQAIAIPGILVRIINASVIKEILAEICGVGKIDDDEADHIFMELKKEFFLLNFNGPYISFRQDLRIALSDLILKDPKYKAKEIHEKAVLYYSTRETLQDKVEFLYHSLKRGDDASIIDRVYNDEMKPFLETSLIELPTNACVHLSWKMGIGVAQEKLKNADQREWELYQKAQIINVLEKGDETQLKQLINNLSARSERLKVGPLAYYEAKVYARLNQPELAKQLITEPLNQVGYSIQEVVEFAILQSTIEEYAFNFAAAHKTLNEKKDTIEGGTVEISTLLEFYLRLFRLEKRLSIDTVSTRERITKVVRESNSPNIDLFAVLPKPYGLLLQLFLKQSKNEVNQTENLNSSLYICFENLAPAELFVKKVNQLAANVSTQSNLERYIRRNFGYLLKDISLPGVFNICVVDASVFIEAFDAIKSVSEPEKVFGSTQRVNVSTSKTFANEYSKTTIDNYIHNEEVLMCLEKLHERFSDNQPLIVSDLLDEQGNQYINLIQNCDGTFNIAMVGYTYVLEQMGIRFMKLAGMGSSSINTTMLGLMGEKTKAKSANLIEKLINVNYFNFVDGPPLIRFLIKNYIKRNTIFATFRQWVTVILLYFSCLFAADIFLIPLTFTNPAAANLLLTIFMITGVSLSFFVVLFYYLSLQQKNLFFALNPGNFLYDWIKGLFIEYGVRTVNEQKTKAFASVPRLHSRLETPYNAQDIEGEISLVATELVTGKKISLPKMAGLFRENLDELQPAGFVRASFSIPLFFSPYVITEIPYTSETVKQAWLDHFRIKDPPTTICLVGGNNSSIDPSDVFDKLEATSQLLPVFTVEVNDNPDKFNIVPLESWTLVKYIVKMLNATRGNFESKSTNDYVIYENGKSTIQLSGHNFLNYFLTDEDKINLFVKGAKTATDFLINFDWDKYKQDAAIAQKSKSLKKNTH